MPPQRGRCRSSRQQFRAPASSSLARPPGGQDVRLFAAQVRKLPEGQPAISPPAFTDLTTPNDYRRFADRVQEVTGGIPIGMKMSAQRIEEDIDFALQVGVDYIILDARSGATGAAPLIFRDNISVPTIPALARARRCLDQRGRSDIALVITGGLRSLAWRSEASRQDGGRHSIDHDQIAAEAPSDGVFPLVTNDRTLSELELLHAYKRQPLIEKRFAQMKTDFQVTPVWLKDAGRIEALLAAYFFALLAEALLERELRQAMEPEGIEALPMYPEGRPRRRPTARRLIDLFETIQHHELHHPGQPPTTLVTELSPLPPPLPP